MHSELRTIPGIGKKMSTRLIELGHPTIASLKKANPDDLYLKLEAKSGQHIDRCVLYTLRCAIAYAKNPKAVTGKNWWHFKD